MLINLHHKFESFKKYIAITKVHIDYVIVLFSTIRKFDN